jgi:hypothetical protein
MMLQAIPSSLFSTRHLLKLSSTALIVVLICTVCVALAQPLHLSPAGAKPFNTACLSLSDTQPQTTRFIAVGDTGSGNANQQAIAVAMKQLYTTNPYQFVLHLGDVIYPVGNVDKDGKRLYTDFYDFWYNELKVPVWVALGNHDKLYKHGKPALKFYNMPAFYYKNSVNNLDIFTLDTDNFTPKQQAWLKQGLANSKARWKLVYGHHPIGTSGEHAREKLVLELRKTLLPTLVEGKADVYLAGHDHDYERFTPTAESPLLTVVSGGGGAYLRNQAEVRAGSTKFIKAHHYLEALVDESTFRLQALDVNNQPLDCVVVKKTPETLSFQSPQWQGCTQVVIPTTTTATNAPNQ